MNAILFVYGTLKRGQPHHDHLSGQEFLSQAETLPRYRLYDCGRYPALVDDPAHGVAIHGEVWRVGDEVLRKMDEYEGVPDLFSRRPVLLQGWDAPVEAYFFQGDVTRGKDCGERWPPEDKIENRR